MGAQWWVYRFWHDDELLYVGSTCEPWTRFRNHATERAWYDKANAVDWNGYPSRQEARAAEREQIALYDPVYNVKRYPLRRSGIPDLSRGERTPAGHLPSPPLITDPAMVEALRLRWRLEQTCHEMGIAEVEFLD